MLSFPLRFLQQALDIFGQILDATDGVKANVLAYHALQLFAQINSQNYHQGTNFLLGAEPVFRRERIEREACNAKLAGGGYHIVNRDYPSAVPGVPGKMTLLSPATIAV